MNIVALVLLVGCDSAPKRLDHGRALVSERKYDEAVKVYESIKADYPDSPEAGQVRDAIDDAHVAVADDLFTDGKFIEAGAAYKAFRVTVEGDPEELKALRARPSSASIARVTAARDRARAKADLDLALDFQAATTAVAGSDMVKVNEGFNTALAAFEAGSAPEFKRAVGSWACENRARYNTYTYCLDLKNMKGDGLTLMNASAAVDKLSGGDEACKKAASLEAMCGPEVAAEIDPALTAVGAAKVALAALRPEMEAQITTAWRTPRAALSTLAGGCEKTKREIIGLMKENSGTSLEFVQNYWGSIGSGSTSPMTSQEGLLIDQFQTDFSNNATSLGEAMKSRMWGTGCNRAIDAAVARARKGCVETGSPVDTSWIAEFMPSDCPYPVFAP